MSNIDLEQDDKATMEMLAMMGEGSATESEASSEAMEVDELLNAIDDAEATESETSVELDDAFPSDIAEEAATAADNHDELNPIADDDIEALLNQTEEAETVAEVSEGDTNDAMMAESAGMPEEMIDDTDSLLAEIEHVGHSDTDDNREVLADTSVSEELPDTMLAAEAGDESSLEMATENLEEAALPELDDIDTLSADLDDETVEASETELAMGDMTESTHEDTTDAEVPAHFPEEESEVAMTEESLLPDVATDKVEAALAEESDLENEQASFESSQDTDTADDSRIVEQAAQSIESMEDALEIDQEIQSIAEEVKQTAQEATLLAIATTQKAHASAEKTQKAIEATFAAAERAFQAAKNAGYSLEMEGVETPLSADEIDAQLEQIREKNEQLRTVNLSLRNQIAEFKSGS